MASGAEEERGLALRELGEAARRNRDLASAQAYYEEACLLLRGSADRLRFAHTARHLGDVYRERQDWPRAEACFVEALEIYRGDPSGPQLDVANAIRGYAVLQSAQGNNEEARGLWAEAGRMYDLLGIAEGVEECKRRLSGESEQE